jgi:hypothetical protein
MRVLSDLLYLKSNDSFLPEGVMKKFSLLVISAAFMPFASLAQDQNNYQCSHGDLNRRVEIVYETGVTVPCEVHYYKDTEAPGERQVLWRALKQEGYCEEKTQEFVRQLASWGWNCGQPEATEEAAEAEEADETEALAPTDEETAQMDPVEGT